MGPPTTTTNRTAKTSHAPAAVGLSPVADAGSSLGPGATARSSTRPQPAQLPAEPATAVPQSGQTRSFALAAPPAGDASGIRGMNRMVGMPQCGHWIVSPERSESNSKCPEQTLQMHRVQLPDGPPVVLITGHTVMPNQHCRERTAAGMRHARARDKVDLRTVNRAPSSTRLTAQVQGRAA